MTQLTNCPQQICYSNEFSILFLFVREIKVNSMFSKITFTLILKFAFQTFNTISVDFCVTSFSKRSHRCHIYTFAFLSLATIKAVTNLIDYKI